MTATLTPAGATVTYQWMICDTADSTYKNIDGATSNTYTLGDADLGKYIKVSAIGTGSYTGTVTSAATGPVVAKAVESIAIKTQPSNLSYVEGQALDLAGLEVTLTYNDGSTEEVAFADFGAKGITAAPAHDAVLATTDTKVTITHTASGKSVDLTITVNPAPVVNASINPTNGNFDKKTGAQANVTTTITWGSATQVTAVKKDGTPLTVNTDYTVEGTILTIKKEYLAQQAVGTVALSIEFDKGAAATLTITVCDSTDTTAPTFATDYPKADNITATGFDLKIQTNEDGKAYFVVLNAGATAPSADQVKAGQDSSGQAVGDNLKGTVNLTANTEATQAVAGLNAETEYDVYVVAEDNVPNLIAAPVKVDVKTAAPDTTAPVLSDNSASDITHEGAKLNFTSSEAGTYYYLIYAAGNAAPTKEAVKAQGTAVAKCTAAAMAGANTANVTGLVAQTAYKAYVVVEDAAGNISEVATIDITTTAAPTKAVTVAAQVGTIIAGQTGTATFAVTTANIADGAEVTIIFRWYQTPTGITASATNVANNVSTITVNADTTAVAGTYDFKVTIDGVSSDVVTLTVTALEATAIAIKTQPTKLSYVEGQTLDLSGLEVTLSYNDGSEETVAFADFGTKGITTTPAQAAVLTTADNKVTITHTESNKSVELTITVAAVDLIGLAI